MLIDFQLFSLYCPVHDLVNAFYLGATRSTLKKIKRYLQLYYNSLSNTLQEFNLDAGKIYTSSTLKQDWEYCAKYGFVLVLVVRRLELFHSDELINFGRIDHENPK